MRSCPASIANVPEFAVFTHPVSQVCSSRFSPLAHFCSQRVLSPSVSFSCPMTSFICGSKPAVPLVPTLINDPSAVHLRSSCGSSPSSTFTTCGNPQARRPLPFWQCHAPVCTGPIEAAGAAADGRASPCVRAATLHARWLPALYACAPATRSS